MKTLNDMTKTEIIRGVPVRTVDTGKALVYPITEWAASFLPDSAYPVLTRLVRLWGEGDNISDQLIAMQTARAIKAGDAQITYAIETHSIA